jgi:hypothetical protein
MTLPEVGETGSVSSRKFAQLFALVASTGATYD